MKNLLIDLLYFKLRILARLIILRFRPIVIAVTGSAGKTSAKEAIFSVLKDFKRVRRSVGNFNSELGIPLTILGDFKKEDLNLFSREMPPGAHRFRKVVFLLKVLLSGLLCFLKSFWSRENYPQVLVLEYGADKPGDINRLKKIAHPDIGVITSVGKVPVHVEFYSSPEAVMREKSHLISEIPPSGWAIINGDDFWKEELKRRTKAQIRTFGTSENCDIKITHFAHLKENNQIVGITFKLEKEGNWVPLSIKNAFSLSHAYTAACALTVASCFDINLVSAAESLSKNYFPVEGRSVILKGVKNIQIIDESYNSSPLALEIALKSLGLVKGKRRVAILGDMAELGEYSQKAHEKIGEELIPSSVDLLITVGEKAKLFTKKVKAFSFENVSQLEEKILSFLEEGDLVLVKGSRFLRLDKIVEKIKA